MNIFKRPLTAGQIKEKARELGADLVGIADGKSVDTTPHHRPRRRPRHRARDPRAGRQLAHPQVERPQQVLQRRAFAHLPRGGVARAGVLAGGRGLSGDHRAADARRSVALRGRPEAAPAHADLAAACGGGSRAGDARSEPATPDQGVRASRAAHGGALLGRRRVRPADDRGAVPRTGMRPLPQGLPGRRDRPVGARLERLRPVPLAAWLRAAVRISRARDRRARHASRRRPCCARRTASTSGKASCAAPG